MFRNNEIRKKTKSKKFTKKNKQLSKFRKVNTDKYFNSNMRLLRSS